MNTRNKPPELHETQVKEEGAKRFIRSVKRIGNGYLFIYQWNVDKSDSAPIGLYAEPNLTGKIAASLEGLGARKTEIKDGSKFDLSTITGYPGSHMEMYSTGKINVQWPRPKGKKALDFANTSLIELLDGRKPR